MDSVQSNPEVVCYHGDNHLHHDEAKKNWKSAALLTRDLPDPWVDLRFEDIQEEAVTRHMYSPKYRKWRTDEIVVKMQSKPFANGAMRECFRMKKLSKFSQHPNWKNASNYVAKRYMKEVPNEAYFDDVKLQMDSKLWGEEYSKLNIPKKVDFCQTYVIEFKGRAGSPLYCVEHFIDGGYLKYNSNSGFVSDVNRLTPQTFSHFTFEKSNHQLIIVDIQGVGDLYTDPQMHTVDQKDYGEANLGTKGMALFFSTHICSPLCEALKLTQFDLSEEELQRLRSRRWNFSSSTTRVSNASTDGNDESSCSASFDEQAPQDLQLYNKGRRLTVADLYQQLSSAMEAGVLGGALSCDRPPSLKISSESDKVSFSLESPLPLETPSPSADNYSSSPFSRGKHFVDFWQEDEGQSVKVTSNLVVPSQGLCRSASVDKERTRLRDEEEKEGEVGGGGGAGSRSKDGLDDSLTVLGMIHLDLARYQEMGRLSEDGTTPNASLTLYHLRKAGECGVMEALYVLGHIYLQLPHEDFQMVSVESSSAHECEGMDYLVRAAEKGYKAAMLEVAKALDTGVGLGKAPDDNPTFTAPQRHQDWAEAITWYRRAMEQADDTPAEDFGLVVSSYFILARMAEMHLKGGHNLPRDFQTAGNLYNEAAEAAMSAMKGKLSAKYFMLAEQAWGEMES